MTLKDAIREQEMENKVTWTWLQPWANESKRKDSSNLAQLENNFVADTELKPDGLGSYTPDQIVAALKAVNNSFGIPVTVGSLGT